MSEVEKLLREQNASLARQVGRLELDISNMGEHIRQLNDNLRALTAQLANNNVSGGKDKKGIVSNAVSAIEARSSLPMVSAQGAALSPTPQPHPLAHPRVPQPKKAAKDSSVASSSGQSAQVQEQGWKLQSTKKKQVEKPAEVQKEVPQDTLEESHWSVPQQKSVSELTAKVIGVAFANLDEAKTLTARPKSDVPQAILCSKPVNGLGERVSLSVKDSKGQPADRVRWLIQLGAGDVVYNKATIAKGGAITPRAMLVTLTVQKGIVKDSLWKKFEADPRHQTREWLTAQGIKAQDVLPPTSKRDGNIRVVLWLPALMEENFLKLCGVDALQTGKYITSEEDRDFFSVVPLPGVSREDALQRAAFHGADTFGVVPLKNGEWAIQVRSTQYESAAQTVWFQKKP